jgi:hypothetical protein
MQTLARVLVQKLKQRAPNTPNETNRPAFGWSRRSAVRWVGDCRIIEVEGGRIVPSTLKVLTGSGGFDQLNYVVEVIATCRLLPQIAWSR